MHWKTKLVLLFLVISLAFSTTACKKEGEGEKAGKKIDKALKDLQK